MERNRAVAYTERMNRLRKEIYYTEEENKEYAKILKQWSSWAEKSTQYIKEYIHDLNMDLLLETSLNLQESENSTPPDYSEADIISLSTTDESDSDDVELLSSGEDDTNAISAKKPPISAIPPRPQILNVVNHRPITQPPPFKNLLPQKAIPAQVIYQTSTLNNQRAMNVPLPKVSVTKNVPQAPMRSVIESPAVEPVKKAVSSVPGSSRDQQQYVKKVDGGVYVSVEYLNTLSKEQKESLSRTIQQNMTYRLDYTYID